MSGYYDSSRHVLTVLLIREIKIGHLHSSPGTIAYEMMIYIMEIGIFVKQDIDFLRHYIFLCICHATRVKHRILITIYYRTCLLIRVILEQLLWHQVMDHKTW